MQYEIHVLVMYSNWLDAISALSWQYLPVHCNDLCTVVQNSPSLLGQGGKTPARKVRVPLPFSVTIRVIVNQHTCVLSSNISQQNKLQRTSIYRALDIHVQM